MVGREAGPMTANTAGMPSHPAAPTSGRGVERPDVGGTVNRPLGDTPPTARPGVPATDNRPGTSPLPSRPDDVVRRR
jgi:hypothetical protein